jgi:hypothetical protein
MPEDMMYSATWATAPVKPSRVKAAKATKSKAAFKVVKPFVTEWLWAEELDVFVSRNQLHQMRRREVFNSRVSSFSDVEDTARLLLKSNYPKCDGVTYEPDERQGVINVGGRRLINTYRPGNIEPIVGDPTPFIEFMDHLFPLPNERDKVLAWMTTLVCRPDVRMRFGILLISLNQGVGKTTLAQDILTPLIGEWNVSFPDETAILDSAFKSWIAHKRLTVVHEICTDDRTKKAYNRLKSIITETIVDVNEKYLRPYTIKNWLHVFACSNTKRALYLDDVDRRWFLPLVTETLLSEQYWTGFHRWLREDGLGIILHYLTELAKKPEYIIGTGEHAPKSATKEEVIEVSRSPAAQIAHDLGKMVVEMNTKDEQKPEKKLVKVVLAIHEVHAFAARQLGFTDENDRRMEKPLAIRQALLRAGMMEPSVPLGGQRKRYKVNLGTDATGKVGTSKREQDVVFTYIVANFPVAADALWEDLKSYLNLARDLWPM